MADPRKTNQHPQIKHSPFAGETPSGLAPGEIAVNVGDTPPTLYAGTTNKSMRVIPQVGIGSSLPARSTTGSIFLVTSTRSADADRIFYFDGLNWRPFGAGGGPEYWIFEDFGRSGTFTGVPGVFHLTFSSSSVTMELPAGQPDGTRVGVSMISFFPARTLTVNAPGQTPFLMGHTSDLKLYRGWAFIVRDGIWTAYETYNKYGDVPDYLLAYENPSYPAVSNVYEALEELAEAPRPSSATFTKSNNANSGVYLRFGGVRSDRSGFPVSKNSFVSSVTVSRSNTDQATIELLVNSIVVEEFTSSSKVGLFDGLSIPLSSLDLISARVKAGSNSVSDIIFTVMIQDLVE